MFDGITLLSGLSAVIVSYLIGSISFAIVFSSFFRLPDPRSVGSGNPGATNMLRTSGKLPALLTLMGDFLKGLLAVWAFEWWTGSAAVGAIAGIGVFLGHLYPIYFGFQGGKGVATAAGVLIAFSPLLGAAALLAWLLTVVITRYVSLGSILAALTAIVCAWLMPEIVTVKAFAVTLMAILLIIRHHQNIHKLLSKTESRIFEKKPD